MISKFCFIILPFVWAVDAELEVFCRSHSTKVYYMFDTTPLTWWDARFHCAQHELNLGSVENWWDEETLRSCLSQVGYEDKWLWTSARGDVSNLRWDQTGQHVNSEYFGEIRNWHGHGSRCGVLSSDFKYLDTNDCNTRHFFLCQKFL